MYSKINSKSRVYFNTEIKHMVRKDKCEFCNSKDNLEVHHKEPLSVTTKKVIEQYKDIKDISALTHIVNSKSIQKGFLTLCSECHLELHKENDDFSQLVKDTYDLKRLQNNKNRIKNIKSNIGGYFNYEMYNNTNLKDEFITLINLKDDRGRLVKSFSKIKQEIEYVFEGSVTLIRERNYKDNGYKNKTYWRITKID